MKDLRQDPTQRSALDSLLPEQQRTPVRYDDIADLEAALMNSAQAWRPRIGALSLDEIRQQRDFWQHHSQAPLSAEGAATRDEMLRLLADRLAQLDAQTNPPRPNRPLTPSEAELLLDPTK